MATESASTSTAIRIPGANPSSSQFTYSNGSYFPLPFHLQQSDPMAVQQYPKPYIPPPPTVQIPPLAKVPAAPVIPSVYSAPAPVSGVYPLPQYQQSVKGMKVVCHELAQATSDPESSALDDLIKDADRLVSCLATKVAKTFDFSLGGASSRSCKYVLNTLMQEVLEFKIKAEVCSSIQFLVREFSLFEA